MANMGARQEWEEIVELARRIDHGVASRQGIDAQEVLRLALAVGAFQRGLTAGWVVTPGLEETPGSER
jgi:hypothetical protein